MPLPDSTNRFSDRVDHYVKYRPTYPPALLDALWAEGFLQPGQRVGDVGSGTGIFTKLLLERGLQVWGIEPNGPMREAAEAWLAPYGNRFVSVDGRAEAMPLPDGSLDALTCAQAFHWVDPVAARREFARVLQPGAPVIILWNNRSVDADPFAAAYDQLLLTHGIGYQRVRDSWVVPDSVWRDFFTNGAYRFFHFDHQQRFDWEGLLGRALSSSYVPNMQHPDFPSFEQALRTVYEAHQVEGMVGFTYRAVGYVGRVGV